MGFEAHSGRALVGAPHPADVIGGDASTARSSCATSTARSTMLGAQSGGRMGELDLGEPIKSCIVQSDQFAPARRAGEDRVARAADLDELGTDEAQLATAQRFLLRELATLDDEIATKTLVDLATQTRARRRRSSPTRARRSRTGATARTT